MKILFVHNRYKYYGGEDATLEAEVLLLKQKGHEVRVVKFDNERIKGFMSQLKAGINSFYNFRSAKIIEQEIKEFHPDILHIHNLFFTASPSVIIKAKKLNVPVVMTIHNYRLICANAILLRDNKPCELCVAKKFPLDGIKYKCYRSSYLDSALVTGITSVHKILSTWRKKIAHYIVLTDFAKEKITHSSLKLAGKEISVKPNFIFDSDYSPSRREEYFLYVGRLSNEKGIDVLLKCFEANSHFKLIIAGNGPEKERLVNRIKASSNIQYVGQLPQEEIFQLMRRCRALIFPSIWYEGLPTTIIEAFSTGTPVIASKLGAMAEMIQDNYNGYHFEPNDSKGLEQKLTAICEAKEELYRQARREYELKYHPEIHYNKIMAIYQQVKKNVG